MNRSHTLRRPLLATTLVALGFTAGLILVGAATRPQEPSAESTRKEPLPVLVAAASRHERYTVLRKFVGRVEAHRESRVGFERGGLVAMVLVDEGDSLAAGQPLARLDTQRLQARREELVNERDQARAELELADLTRRRIREARDLDAVSSQAWDEADKAFASRHAAFQRTESAIASIDVEIAKSELVAPFDALVAERFVDEGQVIETGQHVLQLLERTKLDIRIGVAGDAVDVLEVGDEHEISIRGRRLQASVRAVLPLRGSGTRSVDVVLRLHAKNADIRPGDLAVLKLERPVEEAGFWLPLTALTESSRGLWAAYVAEAAGDGTFAVRRRELEILHPEAERAYLRGTLSEGDLVVLSGLHRLVVGQSVEPTRVDL